jgi:acetyl-CoA acetyltransferase family protein
VSPRLGSSLWSNLLARCYTNQFDYDVYSALSGVCKEIMLKPGDIAIVSGARTPFGRYCGKLKDFTAQELGAVAAKGAIERAGIDAKEFDHTVFGNAQQTSGDALYGARHVGLRAGLPIETPALTVNRLCGSGMQAIVNAAQMIQLEEAKIVLAGGMESMSQAPFVIRGRDGFTLAPGGKLEDSLMVALLDSYCGLYMANTAELYGSEHGITRQMQDEFALRSQQKADAGYKEGRIQEELVPVPLRNSKGEATGESLTEDDHRRPQTTMEGLAKLKAAFGKNGTVTAGNASGIVDGGAAVVVMSLEEVRKRNMEPLGRIVSWGVAGVEPKVMGRGPVPATKVALQKAGLSLDYIDLIEVNEAFAAQYLAVEKELGLDREKVNVNGGAIALGHPLGASGTRLVITLLYELRRRKKKYGLATACIGGGQGIAMIVESMN